MDLESEESGRTRGGPEDARTGGGDGEGRKTQQSPFLTNAVPGKEEAKGEDGGAGMSAEEIVERQERHLEESQGNEVLFKARCRLYYFSEETKALEERADGTMVIEMHARANMAKIAVFRDQLGRLGCNHFINPRFRCKPHGKIKNGWMWLSTEDTVEEDAMRKKTQVFVARFYSEEDSERFGEEYDLGRMHNERALRAKQGG